MKKRSPKGRALFYTRDSEGRSEQAPSEYVGWAIKKASELGLIFDGKPSTINQMINTGDYAKGDLFLDYGISGNIMSRSGLNALIKEAESDLEVSHILIPRRDRLSRPDDPYEGVRLETNLQRLGLTIVYMSKVCEPLGPRQRADIGDQILSMIEFDRAGRDRRDLAQKIIHAQISLAKQGFSTGGNPPYGFGRWLVNDAGEPVRELEKGESVRMRNHHVVWIPTKQGELEIIYRILDMLRTQSAYRIAQILTDERIPSPGAGRKRTDNGVQHTVSGRWYGNAVTAIARNPLLRAVIEHGHRSFGDQLRLTPEGPRELTDNDICEQRQKARVIKNSQDNLIVAKASFAPLVDTEEHQKLLEVLDERGKTQRGKPRSRDPNRNLLGCRIYDMACGWPMYRVPYNKSYRYKCGLYQQSCGDSCDHNHVDGPTAAGFALSCIQQQLLNPSLLPKLEAKLRQLASASTDGCKSKQELQQKQAELADIDSELEGIKKNLARAKTDAQFEAISSEFERLTEKKQSINKQLESLKRQSPERSNPNDQVAVTMKLVEELTKLADNIDGAEKIRQLFDLVDVKLFLQFRAVQPKKRVINKLVGGIVTFGAAKPPIEIYQGETARKKLQSTKKQNDLPSEDTNLSSGESKSLGNVSRGDRSRTCKITSLSCLPLCLFAYSTFVSSGSGGRTRRSHTHQLKVLAYEKSGKPFMT